jgi:hypothetical protein
VQGRRKIYDFLSLYRGQHMNDFQAIPMKHITNNFKDDSLPNRKQRKALCNLLSHAFTDIRSYAWNGKGEQTAELADIFHNIPKEMHGYGLWDLSSLIESLKEYQKKYGGRNYISELSRIFDGSKI